MKDKLVNLPEVYYISLSDSTDRQQSFKNQFLLNDFQNIKMIEAYDGRKNNYCTDKSVVDGFHFEQMDSGQIAATISHLKAIIEWYNNSDSEYAIFFEDDMSIESINYWNFNWQEFVKELPKDWDVIQLSLIKSEIQESDMKLNSRNWDINWSAGSYLIKRIYAKKLIDLYFTDKKYFLKIKYNEEAIPYVEHILFAPAVTNAYTIPLFYEDINFVSTFYQHFIKSTHKETQVDSSNYVKYWWKIKGKEITLNNLTL